MGASLVAGGTTAMPWGRIEAHQPLAGDQDPGLVDLRATAERIPGARLAELPGCGHLDIFTRSDLTLPLVLPFWTETPIETSP
jgi:pimeloyl-ACP methyl ester carboxylesterase